MVFEHFRHAVNNVPGYASITVTVYHLYLRILILELCNNVTSGSVLYIKESSDGTIVTYVEQSFVA